MGIHDGHRRRLKSRFLKQGLEGFEDHNVLELLLFFAIPRSDTNEIAHELLSRFDTLSGVFDAPFDELCKVHGISSHSATLIKMIPRILSAYHSDKTRHRKSVSSTTEVGKYFLPRFYGKKNEELHIMMLDDKGKIIRCEKISEGTVNNTSISAKKIMARVLNSNATSIVMAHNHPGGVALPSKRDLMVTEKIYHTLDMMNIKLLDHIIVADDDFVSLADSGEFEKFKY